ncbi:SpoIIE family protein phosphatase [Streptomyces sp. NPDC048623]|uniref:SpoIIE family protein phosphatase n=1 Tax=Streptomyces sp. NPDC048623 TaxID=3155761 RepID=UPI00342E7D53
MNGAPPDPAAGIPPFAEGSAGALVDGHGRIAGWTPEAQALLGWPAADVVGHPVRALLADPADWPELIRGYARGARDGEAVLRSGRGEDVRVVFQAFGLADDGDDDGDRDGGGDGAGPGGTENGAGEGADAGAGCFVLVTPAALAEGRHQDSAFIRELFLQDRVGLAVLDPELRLLRTNTHLLPYSGVPAELRGRRLGDFLWPQDAAAIEKKLSRVLATGLPLVQAEELLRTVEDPLGGVNIAISAFRLQDPNGRVLGVTALFTDVTETRRAAERLALLHLATARVGGSLSVTDTARELAGALVPGLGDLAVVELADAVPLGEEPAPDRAGRLLLRRTATAGEPAAPRGPRGRNGGASARAGGAGAGRGPGPASGPAPEREAAPASASGPEQTSRPGPGREAAPASGPESAPGPEREPGRAQAPAPASGPESGPGPGPKQSSGPEQAVGPKQAPGPEQTTTAAQAPRPEQTTTAAQAPGPGQTSGAAQAPGPGRASGSAPASPPGNPPSPSPEPDVVLVAVRDGEDAAAGGHPVRMTAPLRARGMLLGRVTVGRRAARGRYAEADRDLLREIADRAALALDNARRFTREHRAAVGLQRSMLPPTQTRTPAVTTSGVYLPADTRTGVGGDWFDVIPLSSARVALVVGDVVGHGLAATATMGRLRTAVRTLADLELEPDELLAHLDDLVSQLPAEPEDTGEEDDGDDPEEDDQGQSWQVRHPSSPTGATCAYAVYDPVTRRCTVASAGHPPPVVAEPDGKVSYLPVDPGPPLGVGGLPFETTEVELAPGSVLALYTDGLIEGRGGDLDAGMADLADRLARPGAVGLPLRELGRELVAGRPADGLEDDVTLLLARTRAVPAEDTAAWSVEADPAAVGAVREAAAAQLRAWGLEELVFTTELVLSELVTNAIRYAGGPVEARLVRAGRLICEVSDPSATHPRMRRARLTDEGGRGLFLVAQLTTRWGSRYSRTGKTIWGEQELPPGAPPYP